jgi:hypothetical protein
VQVHRDMFEGKFAGGLFATADRSKPIVLQRRASKMARR